MSVRSFTQIIEAHAVRAETAAVLMSDPAPNQEAAAQAARLFDTNVQATVTTLKPSDWDQLTGRA